MFIGTSNKSIKNTGLDWVNGVQGKDLFNSKLLFDLKLKDPDSNFMVARYEDRLDLIKLDIYKGTKSSSNVEGFLILKNHIDPYKLPIGLTLKVFREATLESLGKL
jgi:acyl CoA:acetate/3-ketoacid CoA transferase